MTDFLLPADKKFRWKCCSCGVVWGDPDGHLIDVDEEDCEDCSRTHGECDECGAIVPRDVERCADCGLRYREELARNHEAPGMSDA